MNGIWDSPPTKRYGSWSPNCLTSDNPRPIKRLTDNTVFKGSADAANLADSPTSSAVGVITHGGRQDHLPIGVRQWLGQAAAQGSNQGIGGAQVNPDRQATLVRLRALAGFGDLQ